jgi:hypothetical protein
VVKFLAFVLTSIAGSFAGAGVLRIGLTEVFPTMSYTDWLKLLFTLSVLAIVSLVFSIIVAMVSD